MTDEEPALGQVQRAQAFAALEAVRAGAFDGYLPMLKFAIRHRDLVLRGSSGAQAVVPDGISGIEDA